MNFIYNKIPGGIFWLPLLIGLLGYSILNRGFAYIGVYPFFWGELCLIFYLILIKHSKIFKLFLKILPGKIFVILNIYCVVIFIVSSGSDFNESLRNSILWVYTLFLYFGFAFGCAIIRKNELWKLEKFLFFCSICTVIYYFIYPVREYLLEITPFLSGGSVSLVGYYSTLHALALGFVFLIIFTSSSRLNLLLFILGIFFIIGVSQSRAALIAFILIIGYLIFFGRNKNMRKNLVPLLGLSLLLGLAYFISGVTIEGDRGSVSSGFLESSISSVFSESGVDSLDGSRRDRMYWWGDVINRVVYSPSTLLFGLGLDELLVKEFSSGANALVRYPHNSYVSVVGFLGVIGLLLFLSLLFSSFYMIYKKSLKPNSNILLKWYPVFFIGFFVSAFFSTVFEAPFHSFVFWIITGILCRVSIETETSSAPR